MPELSAEQRRGETERLQAKVLARTDAAAGETASELSAADVDLLAILAAERLNDGRVRVNLDDGRADVTVSTRFPAELGGWLNLDARVVQTDDTLAVERLVVGGLPVPQIVASWLFDQAVARLKSPALLAGIELTPGGIRLRPSKNLDASRGLLAGAIPEQDLALAGDAQQRLVTLVEARANQSSIDAAELLSALIASDASDDIDPAAQNRAAILALAAYVNGRRITGADLSSVAPQVPLEFAGRKDAAQHFFSSAALAMQGGSELAESVGLSKELDDADGGSGFSFRDIAANRAGNRFAELAGGDPETASRINTMARSGFNAADLMPPVDWLPENMSQAAFRRDFGGRDGRAYQIVLDEIDRRIDQLPISQISGAP
jgi:hypothetical protein